MRMILGTLLALLGWCALPAIALAQVPARGALADFGALHIETPHGGDIARDVPIGGYTLATFWVPQHCKQAIRGITALECEQPEIRARGLALHGLWPDGVGREWPQWCKAAALLSRATVTAHYGATPSAQQMQHEWAKHGTCIAGMTPERYFDRAEALYRAVHIPDLRALSYRDQTVASVKQAIADANPGLRPDMFKLTLDRKGWLEEIWFCLGTDFSRKVCAEPQREGPEAKVLIWRGGRGRAYGSRRGDTQGRYDYRRPRASDG